MATFIVNYYIVYLLVQHINTIYSVFQSCVPQFESTTNEERQMGKAFEVFMVVALVLALLGVLGMEAATRSVLHPVVAHMQRLTAITPNSVDCGGGSSTYCA